jgi:hypothetical protein
MKPRVPIRQSNSFIDSVEALATSGALPGPAPGASTPRRWRESLRTRRGLDQNTRFVFGKRASRRTEKAPERAPVGVRVGVKLALPADVASPLREAIGNHRHCDDARCLRRERGCRTRLPARLRLW